jgi:hypothetical protein
VHSAPIEVKKAAMYAHLFLYLQKLTACSKTSLYYICTGCQSFFGQPLGKLTEKVHERSGSVNYLFKTQAGPPVPERCPECNSALHVSDLFDLDSAHMKSLRRIFCRWPVQCGQTPSTIKSLSRKSSSISRKAGTNMVLGHA